MYVTLPDAFAPALCCRPDRNAETRFDTTPTARPIRKGAILFNEGDDANYLYEVVSGVVRLTRVTLCGRRQVIAFGFPGDILGFPSGGRYHTDCDVIEEGEVRVHSRRILEACTDDPALHRYLVNAAMSEISGMQDHFVMLGRKSASEKVAAFLSVLLMRIGTVSGGVGRVHLPMCRSDIADFLGLTTETVSRTISGFRAAGVIELKTAKHVIVRDPQALRDLSEEDR